MKKFFIHGSIMLICIFSNTSFAELTDGLAAYYPFNGNANDESINENNGIVNGATLTEDRFGNLNSAYIFDGLDDYIITEYTPSQNIGRNLTITLWMNWKGDSGQRFGPFNGQRFLAKWAEGGVGNFEYCFSIWEGDYRIGVAGENANANIVAYRSTDVQPIENNWTFIVVTYDEVEAKIYVNNQIISTVRDTQFSATTGEADEEPLVIGGGCSSGNLPVYIFNGALDDIRLYNRVLSEEEIGQLFNEKENDIFNDNFEFSDLIK